MSPSHQHRSTRARQIGACLVVMGVALTTAVMVQSPVAGAATDPLGHDAITLGEVEAVAPESITAVPATADDAAAAAVPGAVDPLAPQHDDGTVNDDLDQSLGALRRTRAGVAAERDTLQTKLLRLEHQRTAAEERLDATSDALARHLVKQFEADASDSVTALIAVRDEGNPELRAALLASMDAPDRAIITAMDEASAAVGVAAQRAEATRSALRTVTLRISAIDAVLEDRRPLAKHERERRDGKRRSFDADLVFTTGAIPGIGYWGPASESGSMLTGWTGFAGAALGGVGCTAPDAALQPSGTIEAGEASWYGPGFHGNNTANGEVYDQNAMTAAHKTLPFGSVVRVFSSSTGRCAFVRINDRGPFIEGRIIDLSHAAATAIGMSGTAPVQIEVWSQP